MLDEKRGKLITSSSKSIKLSRAGTLLNSVGRASICIAESKKIRILIKILIRLALSWKEGFFNTQKSYLTHALKLIINISEDVILHLNFRSQIS